MKVANRTRHKKLRRIEHLFRTAHQYEDARNLLFTFKYALQKHRTSINRNTNFLRRRYLVCNADLAKKQDLSCMIAISTSTILLQSI